MTPSSSSSRAPSASRHDTDRLSDPGSEVGHGAVRHRLYQRCRHRQRRQQRDGQYSPLGGGILDGSGASLPERRLGHSISDQERQHRFYISGIRGADADAWFGRRRNTGGIHRGDARLRADGHADIAGELRQQCHDRIDQERISQHVGRVVGFDVGRDCQHVLHAANRHPVGIGEICQLRILPTAQTGIAGHRYVHRHQRAAWTPANWAPTALAAGTATIQSNAGQLSNSDGYQNTALYLAGALPTVDTDLSVDVTLGDYTKEAVCLHRLAFGWKCRPGWRFGHQ